MMIPKTKPYRSKAFLRFCHEMGGACALCGGPFEQLHHFGNDGGRSMKPSDNEVVRLCERCHSKTDFKALSLWKNGKESD
jgi:Zn-finger protein